jgi:hypothetical protein
MSPSCHEGYGLDAVYEGGIIILSCHFCNAEVASIVVANRYEPITPVSPDPPGYREDEVQ